jgi:hypothetical protein
MGTNHAPVYIFIRSRIYSKASTWDTKALAEVFYSTITYMYRYISDVLPINTDQFHSYVDSISPNELEIKDITKCSTSFSYLDIIGWWRFNSMRNRLISIFPSSILFNYLEIFHLHLQLIRKANVCFTYEQLWIWNTEKEVEITRVSTDSTP